MAEKQPIIDTIDIPEGVNLNVDGSTVTVSGEKGEVSRKFENPRVRIELKGNELVLKTEADTRKDKTILKTYKAHIKNAIKGVTEGYTYKLKICSGHFPMTVSVSGNVLEIKNFLGEKIPRKVKLMEGANVKVDGNFITVESQIKERAGQVAADIEQATRRPGFDKRIFQDGIYIVEKAGQPI